MSDTMKFKVFCLESYKQEHNMSGKEALDVFKRFDVFDYITSVYDDLHSYGQKYIVLDIDEYLSVRQ